MSSRLKVETVAAATRKEPEGGDVLAQARIDRERDQAALRFRTGPRPGKARGNDGAPRYGGRRGGGPSRSPTAAEALAYLEELPSLWARTSDAGRHAIAEATFERIDVLGVTDFSFALTAHAKAHGWDAAFGAGVVSSSISRSGRGERARPRGTYSSGC